MGTTTFFITKDSKKRERILLRTILKEPIFCTETVFLR
ncbi:hypothetical protein LEP1GSC089_2194 [Leptospira interrogans serovar Autumnalis str. LP101]|nr:hypothetical protein LEP1GSC089_2194 [Leptospira interrogans serovar Autumnalis str. LP101]